MTSALAAFSRCASADRLGELARYLMSAAIAILASAASLRCTVLLSLPKMLSS